jgi:tetratricopeptide (TPR) repeat protein
MLAMTQRDGWSLLGVLFFALHPVQTESVSVIVSRNNIFSTFFMLITLYGYIRWWERKSALAFTCSLIAFIGALFSKEFGLMSIPILFLYQRFLSQEKDIKREIESYLPYIVIMAFYLILRAQVVASSFAVTADFWRRLYFTPYLVIYNLRVLFLPYELHNFYVVYPQSMLDVTVLASILAFCLLLLAMYHYRKESLLLFSGTAFLLSLVPILNLVKTSVVSLIAMRWLYLPLALVSLSLVWALGRVPHRRRVLVVVCAVIMVSYIGGYAYVLNRNLWYNEDAAVRLEVLHFQNALFFGDYAEKLFQQRDLEQAEQYFALALQDKTAKVRDYINLGALLIELRKYIEAIQVLVKAQGMTMTHQEQADWHNNMGVAMTMAGDLDQASAHMRRALILDGRNIHIRRNTAALLTRQGRVGEAAEQMGVTKHLDSGGR